MIAAGVAAGIAAGDDPVTWTGSHTWSKAGPQILSNADSQLLIGHSTDPGWSLAAVHVGARGALFGTTTSTFGSNVYTDGTEKYIATAAAGKIDINGNAISLRTAPSGTAGNAITWTTAIITADPGLVAIGAGAAAASPRILSVGSNALATPDITSSGSPVIVRFGPSFKTDDVTSYVYMNYFVSYISSTAARTVTELNNAYITQGSKDANTTITTYYNMHLVDPTLGGTTNRTIFADSGAHLTTAGTWTNASSREYKNVIQYLDSSASYKARKAEMVAMRPAMVQWKADHLVHPVRTQAQLDEYNAQHDTVYASLAELNAAGIATDARWNGPVLEAYRFGRWEIVGTDCKPMSLTLIAEELPEIARTKDGKGLDTGAVCAWLLEISKAQQADIDRLAVAAGIVL